MRDYWRDLDDFDLTPDFDVDSADAQGFAKVIEHIGLPWGVSREERKWCVAVVCMWGRKGKDLTRKQGAERTDA